MGSGHKSEHTKMVNKVLRELAKQQDAPVSTIFDQLFHTRVIVNAGILNETFRETFQQLYPDESFNHVIWCPFCQCFDLTHRADPVMQGEAFWTLSSTQF